MDTLPYVNWFRSASPYINAHRGKTFVLAIGGAAVAHANFANIAQDVVLLQSLGVRLLIVHGAQPQISAQLQRNGIEARDVDGLRVTDQRVLPHVIAGVGQVRAHIEALLSAGVAQPSQRGYGVRVVGGNFVTAKPIGVQHGVDFEHTGDVRKIDAGGLHAQLAQNNIVLVSPLAYSPSGETFNLGAGELAARVAVAVGADKLILFTPQAGMLTRQAQLVRELDLTSAQQALQADDTNDDLKKILGRAVYACERRVARSHIICYEGNGALLQELFSRAGSGTLISQQSFETIRQAGIDDINGIIDLIAPLEADGTLVKRSREKLEHEIDRFTVIEREDSIIACAALYPYPTNHAGEVACVVTHADYRGEQRGEKLLAHLCTLAQQQQLTTLFVLTTKAAHWFQEQGFEPNGIDALPPERQSLYNLQRNSKVFAKHL